jgi:tetracycline repressor-like protein
MPSPASANRDRTIPPVPSAPPRDPVALGGGRAVADVHEPVHRSGRDGRHPEAAVAIIEEAGAAPPAGDLFPLAFRYVRIMESVLYSELFSGCRVDFAVAERALRAVLA